MPKRSAELTAAELKQALKTSKPQMLAVGGVIGLYLHRGPSGAASWVLRVTVPSGRRRDLGLGSYPTVTLDGARDHARKAHDKIAEGIDPIEARRATRQAARADKAAAVTFDECARRYIAAHEAEWKSAKHADQWRSTLATYASPKIGSLLVRDVGVAQVLAVLAPIWTTKTETASRLRGRIESVLDYAKAHGYRTGDNPAAWRGNLDHSLAKRSKIAPVVNHAALPYKDIGSFMVRLRAADGTSARALEMAILCASRSGEVRGMTWAEVDLEEGLWVIPGRRMKAGKPHRVPLSAAAVQVLRSMLPADGSTPPADAIVFPGRAGKPLSDMSLGAVLKRLKVDVTAHGFRSSFRTWAGEETAYPREMFEIALAHSVGDATEQAYARGDMIAKRRGLMEDWAAYCAKTGG